MFHFYNKGYLSDPSNPRRIHWGGIVFLLDMLIMCALIFLSVAWPQTWLGVGFCSIPFIFLAALVSFWMIFSGQ